MKETETERERGPKSCNYLAILGNVLVLLKIAQITF